MNGYRKWPFGDAAPEKPGSIQHTSCEVLNVLYDNKTASLFFPVSHCVTPRLIPSPFRSLT